MQQLTFASLAYALKKEKTRKEKFPSEMKNIVPWQEEESEAGSRCR